MGVKHDHTDRLVPWPASAATATRAESRERSTSWASAGRCWWCESCFSARSASRISARVFPPSAPTCSRSVFATSREPGSCTGASSRPPPARGVYELTDRGYELEPVVLGARPLGQPRALLARRRGARDRLTRASAHDAVRQLRGSRRPCDLRAAARRAPVPRARGARRLRGGSRRSRRPRRDHRRPTPRRCARFCGTGASSARPFAPAT